MKLLRVFDGGRMEIVQTENRLAGHLDAILTARQSGDGRYIADFEDGSYLPFEVAAGEVGGIDPNDFAYGNPAQKAENNERMPGDPTVIFDLFDPPSPSLEESAEVSHTAESESV